MRANEGVISMQGGSPVHCGNVFIPLARGAGAHTLSLWREELMDDSSGCVCSVNLRFVEKCKQFSNVNIGFVFIIKKRVNTKLYYFMSNKQTRCSH